VHAAGRHKQTFVGASSTVLPIHCMVVGNCFCHFVVRTSSNRSIASGAWPTVSYTQLRRRALGKCFGTSHVQQSSIADSQLLDQNRDFCLYPTCIRHPVRGVPVGISPPRLAWKNYGYAELFLRRSRDRGGVKIADGLLLRRFRLFLRR